MLKPIPFAPNYSVSSDGYVINPEGHLLKNRWNNKGYAQVFINGKQYLVHRLVALAFIPNPENKYFVNHKDTNTRNNKLENLEWCTRSENNKWDHAGFKRNYNKMQPVRCITTGKSYPFIKMAADDLKLDKSQIAKTLREGRSKVGQYEFEYLPKDTYTLEEVINLFEQEG